MSTRQQRRLQKRKRNRNLFIALLVIIFLIIGISVKHQHEHFRKGTLITTVDCSGLSVENAFKKINEHFQEITYVFVDNSFTSQNSLDIKLDDINELENILESQNKGNENREYTLSSISIDEVELKNYLSTFPCFQEENIKKAQNAYLALGDDNRFYIEPEVLGNELDFEEAYQLALSSLKSGNNTVDFREITKVNPNILSTSPVLHAQQYSLNNILDTTINYTLPNGSIFTLDSNTIKNWIHKDENEEYQIALYDNLKVFTDELSKKVLNANHTVVFNTTDSEAIEFTVPWYLRGRLDQEGEINQIYSELGSQVTRSPIYKSNPFSFDEHTSYVEIDTTSQNVWMYVDGKCVVDTSCVTGNYPNHHTPSGLFTLTFKEEDRYLRGNNDDGSQYNSYVNYWMPFNGDIGMHDATWRKKFGGTIYKGNGSHGCVNLPLEAAGIIYENITKEMPIVVYRS